MNQRPLIIGLGHQARHGKDSIAKIIAEEYGQRFKIATLPFGLALKEEVNQYAEKLGGMVNLFTAIKNREIPGFPALPDWVVYEHEPDMTDPLCPLGKQRTLLQWWGTELRRYQDENYWVKEHRKRVGQLALKGVQVVLTPDLRFPNEFRYIVAEDGETVKVTRANFNNGLASHYSEVALSGPQWMWHSQILCDEWPDAAERDREMRKLARELMDQIIDERVNIPMSPLMLARFVERNGEQIRP